MKINNLHLDTVTEVFTARSLWGRVSNWNFAVLVFVEGGKLENPEKNPQNRGKNQYKFNPGTTCMTPGP